MLRKLLMSVTVLAGVAAANVCSAQDSTVNVLYAGSLVNLMEHSVGPAFNKQTGLNFQGYAAGSNKIANEIKGKLRRGDVFISASPKVNTTLMGADNGDHVTWYVTTGWNRPYPGEDKVQTPGPLVKAAMKYGGADDDD